MNDPSDSFPVSDHMPLQEVTGSQEQRSEKVAQHAGQALIAEVIEWRGRRVHGIEPNTDSEPLYVTPDYLNKALFVPRRGSNASQEEVVHTSGGVVFSAREFGLISLLPAAKITKHSTKLMRRAGVEVPAMENASSVPLVEAVAQYIDSNIEQLTGVAGKLVDGDIAVLLGELDSARLGLPSPSNLSRRQLINKLRHTEEAIFAAVSVAAERYGQDDARRDEITQSIKQQLFGPHESSDQHLETWQQYLQVMRKYHQAKRAIYNRQIGAWQQERVRYTGDVTNQTDDV